MFINMQSSNIITINTIFFSITITTLCKIRNFDFFIDNQKHKYYKKYPLKRRTDSNFVKVRIYPAFLCEILVIYSKKPCFLITSNKILEKVSLFSFVYLFWVKI